MAGQGKYTKFAPEANDKNTLMSKLYKSGPMATLVGKETEAREATVELAKVMLTPGHQNGDLGMFPNGVDLNYSGKSAAIQPPNTVEGKDVVWSRPGDPANSYIPDITSPGPGKTDGLDKDTNPEIAAKDIKPNYVATGPDTGTRSPTVTNKKISAGNVLGTPDKLGDSGANS